MTRGHRPAAGFTLLELLIVLGLVAMVLALAWPSLEAAFESEQLPAAAGQVETVVREGRRLSFERGIVYRIEVETQTSAIRAVPDVNEPSKPPATNVVSGARDEAHDTVEQSLPHGVSVAEFSPPIDEDVSLPVQLSDAASTPVESVPAVVAAAGEPAAPAMEAGVAQWRLFARLYPDGSADEAKLVLRDPKVREVEVSVQSLAGEVRIRNRTAVVDEQSSPGRATR